MAIEIFKEKRVHSSRLVPFSYYESYLPDYFSDVPLHWHKEFELNYIISGEGEFICGDDRFIFEEGDIIILQPDVLHAVYQSRDCVKRYDTLVFSREMLVGTGTDRSSLELFCPLADGSLLVDTRITQSHERYSELAAISHLSRSYFMSCFKNAAGVGAIEYINQIRIKAVCELLRADERTISEIAFGCGFTNLANFNRQFKRQVGASPKEYRKMVLRG